MIKQVWYCKKCDLKVEQPVMATAVFCRDGHALKLIEGEEYLPRKKKA